MSAAVREPVHANRISQTQDGSTGLKVANLAVSRTGTPRSHHLLERSLGFGDDPTGLSRTRDVRGQRLCGHEQSHEIRIATELFASQHVLFVPRRGYTEEVLNAAVGTDGLETTPRCILQLTDVDNVVAILGILRKSFIDRSQVFDCALVNEGFRKTPRKKRRSLRFRAASRRKAYLWSAVKLRFVIQQIQAKASP